MTCRRPSHPTAPRRAATLSLAALVLAAMASCGDASTVAPLEPELARAPRSAAAHGQARVTICHKGSTLQVVSAALAAHLAHGDTEGACGDGGPQCVPAPTGLVGWWAGDGNATDRVGGNDGILMNGIGFAPGVVGQAFHMDGVDDHVFLGNPAALQLQNFSLVAWVKRSSVSIPNQSGRGAAIFGYGPSGYAYSIAGPNVVSGPGGLNPINEHEVFISKNGWNGVSTSLAVSDTDWHHVAVTKVGGTVSFYVDGQGETVPISYDPGFGFGSDAAIGVVRYGVLVSPFHGLIDEMQVFDRALTASEVASLYEAGGLGVCPG